MPNKRDVPGSNATFKSEEAITQNAAVRLGAAEDGCRMPGAANPKDFIGFARDVATASGTSIEVQRGGIGLVIAAAAITINDRLYVSGTNGRVSTIPTNATAQTYQCVGQAREAASTAANEIYADLFWPPVEVES